MGKVMPYIGCKLTLITGIIFVSAFNIVFGFLPWIENKTLFVIGCFTCRVGMALGLCGIQNSIFVTVALTWPNDIAFR